MAVEVGNFSAVSRQAAVEVELGGRSLKAALKRADREGFRAVAIVGEDELQKDSVSVRDLAAGSQTSVPSAGQTAMPKLATSPSSRLSALAAIVCWIRSTTAPASITTSPSTAA